MRHGLMAEPPNRFETVHREQRLEHVEWDQQYLQQLDHRTAEYFDDDSKSIVSENSSLDILARRSQTRTPRIVRRCEYRSLLPTG